MSESEREDDRPSKIASKYPTHMVSLSVAVRDEDSWRHVWENLSLVSSQLGPTYQCNVSSTMLLEDELNHDDRTVLVRAEQAMIRSGLTREQAGRAIDELLKAGILFQQLD